MKKQIFAVILSLVMALTTAIGFTSHANQQGSNDTQAEQSKKPSKSTRNFLDAKDN